MRHLSRSSLILSLILVLGVSAPAFGKAGAEPAARPVDDFFVVLFDEAPLATYDGGVAGAKRLAEVLAEYRQVVRETESLKIYNDNLERVVMDQRAEVVSINEQLDGLEATNRGVVPLMLEMIDSDSGTIGKSAIFAYTLCPSISSATGFPFSTPGSHRG